MNRLFLLSVTIALCLSFPASSLAEPPHIEISDDGREAVVVEPSSTDGTVSVRGRGVPYGTAPDWENSSRRQVGGLQVADMNGDGLSDVVVGCYRSDSFPPYTDWENLIYYNTGSGPEAAPSWVSTDGISTGDIQVADINGDGFPDIFAASGYYTMPPSVIYWGADGGPSTSPGWFSAEPTNTWNNFAAIFDFDHDGDLDIITANQAVSPDPYRPMYIFRNNGGTVQTAPSWQSVESGIQNCIDFADYDGDGWEDMAVSKWANFESGVYKNVNGALQTGPIWTTGTDTSDKGVSWADVDGNGWPDLALGHNPTLLYSNTAGVLTNTWASTASYFGHSELRFHDVDRDGDPDLAEIHFSNGKVHIYLNQNGVLDTAPTWTYDSPTVGTALAFGDLNGDCWPDLVVGNSGEPCVKVFYAIPLPPGDMDGNELVDLADFSMLYGCRTGPDAEVHPSCQRADLDCDGDSDLADFVGFQRAYP